MTSWIALPALGLAALVVLARWRRGPSRPHASIDPAQCSRCLECLVACGHDALSAEGGHVSVDPTRCRGCGRCVDRCHFGAISLVEPRPGAPARMVAQTYSRESPRSSEPAWTPFLARPAASGRRQAPVPRAAVLPWHPVTVPWTAVLVPQVRSNRSSFRHRRIEVRWVSGPWDSLRRGWIRPISSGRRSPLGLAR